MYSSPKPNPAIRTSKHIDDQAISGSVAAQAAGSAQDTPASLELEEFMEFTAPHAIGCGVQIRRSA